MGCEILAAFATGISLGVTIEYCQYSLALGLAETDDVIYNATNAVANIGFIRTNPACQGNP